MDQLSQVLEQVRQKIARYQGRQINEQNTKTALINPVLAALNWDVGDLEQVQQEYKRRPRDNPVDYALLVMRAPRLFVEAKALGQDLSDRRWANQIMGYATVAGVEWVVITNGDEYRIYNACAAVPVEEKVFRIVKISEEDSPAEETLRLLSRERISENEIEVLWKAHFVDRQVHAALAKLFSTQPDASLVRLLKKKYVKDLPANDIRASLRRVQAQFDFPVKPEPLRGDRATVRSAAAKKAWATRRSVGASLKDLIEAGIIKTPLKLTRQYKDVALEAEVAANGKVTFQGKTYNSLSDAASAAKVAVVGRPVRASGWGFWRYHGDDGKLVPLTAARKKLLERK